MAKISRLTEMIQTKGVGEVLRRVVRRFWEVREMIIYEIPFEEMNTFPKMPRVPYVVRCLSEKDLHMMEPLVSAQVLELYRKRLARNEVLEAVLAPDEKQCVGWMWATDHTLYEPYDSATYVALPGRVLHYDGQVIPELRGRLVAFVIYPYHRHFWEQRGGTHSVCAIAETNRASRKVHERIGYVEVGRFTHRRFLKREWIKSRTERVVPGDQTANA